VKGCLIDLHAVVLA
jgi:hypothetical protein